MSFWVAYPAKQEDIESGGDNWWLCPKNQIGNGPWVLKALSNGVSATFVSNPNYYDGEPDYDIELKYIEDSAQALDAYQKNELDIIPSGADQLTEINAGADLKSQHVTVTYPGSCTIVTKFNLHPTWNGKNIRSPIRKCAKHLPWHSMQRAGLVM